MTIDGVDPLTRLALEAEHFTGWTRVAAFVKRDIPDEPGVYLFVRPDTSPPCFLDASTAGTHKGRDATESLAALQSRWVDAAAVVYIGKAGSATGSSTLRSRVDAMVRQGRGNSAGHFGGRRVWQLTDSGELVVAWRVTAGADAERVESELVERFLAAHGALPFANGRRGPIAHR